MGGVVVRSNIADCTAPATLGCRPRVATWLIASATGPAPALVSFGNTVVCGPSGLAGSTGMVAFVSALLVSFPMSVSECVPARKFCTSMFGVMVNGCPVGSPVLSRACAVSTAVSSSCAGILAMMRPLPSAVMVTGLAGVRMVLPSACHSPTGRSTVICTLPPATALLFASSTLICVCHEVTGCRRTPSWWTWVWVQPRVGSLVSTLRVPSVSTANRVPWAGSVGRL